MPGNQRVRDDLRWEQSLAAVSLAGIRPLVNSSVTPAAGAAASYTVTHKATKRVVVLHGGATLGDIRFDLAAGDATAGDFPVLGSVYFVVEAEKDEVISFYNTTGSGIVVYILEIM